METTIGTHWGYTGIMENKTEPTICGGPEGWRVGVGERRVSAQPSKRLKTASWRVGRGSQGWMTPQPSNPPFSCPRHPTGFVPKIMGPLWL